MAPAPSRSRIAAFACLFALLATPAHALRVASYNLMRYQVTNTTTPITSRQPALRTIFSAMQPDIVLAQELNDSNARDSLLNNVFNVIEPGQWAVQWTQVGTEGGAIYYKPAKVAISNFGTITTGGPRPVIQALCKPVGYNSKGGWFRIYSMHLKASTADTTTRRLECSSLRSSLNAVNTTVVGTNFILGGDTNFYSALEGGYIRLTESQSNNNGRCFDPLNMPGGWNSNPAYAPYFTQCPQLSPTTADFSGGGMDDRFDMILSSSSMQDGSGLDYVSGALPNGYGAFGNDGNHFNIDINGNGFNNAVGLDVANALHDAADHIPVVLNLQLPAKIVAESQLAFGDVIVGGSAGASLHVSNGANAPADVLRYSFAAPAGFTAPSGNFVIAAGVSATTQSLSMDTSVPGVRTGALAVATNDVDTTTKQVQLSGRVLAHASASLDSATVITNASLDFGDHAAALFTDGAVRVQNQGYNALQARLSVTAASITGGAGRFSIVGGFSPALLAGTGATLPIHFDATGATLDSTYTATLTITSADEALSGAQAASPLTVSLRARPITATTGVGGGSTPLALRFLPPRPNPFQHGTALEFDLPQRAVVDLAIYDLNGRRVAKLVSGELGEGHHSLRWNTQDEAGRPVAAGLYFARFRTAGLERVVRLALLP